MHCDLLCDPRGFAHKLIRYRVGRLIGQYGFLLADVPDLEQELRLHLMAKLPQFDARRSRLNTFVDRVVTNKIRNLVRDRHSGRRDYRRCRASLDAADPYQPSSLNRDHRPEAPSRSRPAGARSDLRVDLHQALGCLNPQERQLCRWLMQDSLSSYARQSGLPRTSLYKMVRHIRRRFEDAGLKNYLPTPDTSSANRVGKQ